MFGTYRTILAVMVVFTHLAGVRGSGSYAVFGFYTLSGYLMTLVMHRGYGYCAAGIYQYGLNRALRVFPLYWIAALFSVALILWAGKDFAAGYRTVMSIPENIWTALQNIFLAFPPSSDTRLVPPAWSLTVEIFFYVAIGLGLSKTKGTAWVWFILSVAYHVIVSVLRLGWAYKYHIIPAASLPFSTGALVYLYKDEIRALIDRLNLNREYIPHLLVALMFVNLEVSYLLGTTGGLSFYANYLINAAIVMSLSNRDSLFGIPGKFDRWMGEFSYPVFLIHYQVGLLVVIVLGMFGMGIGRQDAALAFLSLPVIAAIAWILIVGIERPMEIIRARVKAGRADGKNRLSQNGTYLRPNK